MSYRKKYIKYKEKYLNLKNQYGGKCSSCTQYGFTNHQGECWNDSLMMIKH